ncbi:hypothetical protein AVEN_255087-1 [Araneus ventricosus]|uniref:Tc1-like transposase DDE domain-containing protein n=1 Tax=Araneus ventricosus TaxID=182803 RepID=A0A4Y2EDL5_ARAVE|nr:hypothetical protein AVEN_255087-1 [Araneus ventricosus]
MGSRPERGNDRTAALLRSRVNKFSEWSPTFTKVSVGAEISFLDVGSTNKENTQPSGIHHNGTVLPFSQYLHDEYALVTLIFQDDNSTVHWTGRICDWFHKNSHTLLHLDLPAKSPDPIENLWDMLEQRVKRRNQHPRNLVDLRDQILSEWLKLDATCLQNLVDTFPN